MTDLLLFGRTTKIGEAWSPDDEVSAVGEELLVHQVPSFISRPRSPTGVLPRLQRTGLVRRAWDLNIKASRQLQSSATATTTSSTTPHPCPDPRFPYPTINSEWISSHVCFRRVNQVQSGGNTQQWCFQKQTSFTDMFRGRNRAQRCATPGQGLSQVTVGMVLWQAGSNAAANAKQQAPGEGGQTIQNPLIALVDGTECTRAWACRYLEKDGCWREVMVFADYGPPYKLYNNATMFGLGWRHNDKFICENTDGLYYFYEETVGAILTSAIGSDSQPTWTPRQNPNYLNPATKSTPPPITETPPQHLFFIATEELFLFDNATDQMIEVMLLLVMYVAAWATAIPLTFIVLRWVVIFGRMPSGAQSLFAPLVQRHFFIWHIADTWMKPFIEGRFEGTFLGNWYYRLLGMRIGW